MQINNIYKMDCIEGLKLLQDKMVNVIITDPPYGDNAGYGRMDKEIENNEHPLLNCQMLFESWRVLKDDGVIYNFTNWKHYPFLTEFITRYTKFNIRHLVVCNKKRIGMGYGFRNKYELIIVLDKGKGLYKTNDFPNVIDFGIINHTEFTHPHQKPEALIRKLILHSSNEGDLVLDCFVGSGTTAVACKQLNRDFIGFEIDEKYVEMANKRLAQTNVKNWF